LSDLSVGALLSIIAVLVMLSAFFSSTETALMSLNRYRLRHRASQGHRSARIVEKLLERPDRLIGVILLGNNVVNIGAATLTGILALRLGGEPALAIGTSVLTAVVLIFGEITPKTYGALYPERLAYPAGWVYFVLVRALYPAVWICNVFSNGILKLLGVSTAQTANHSLSADELRTVVAEANSLIPSRHQHMLMSILDLEKVSVDDIMIPRNEIAGLDMDNDWDDILEVLRTSPHTRLPVYEGSLENIVGILHLKKVAQALAHGRLDKEELFEIARAREPYYVPSGTTLNTQLLNFQRLRRRIALIVNEYGDVQGLVTLEDLLEEIVGEFTTDPGILHKDIHREADGSFLVNGSINIRTLNRRLGWNLPIDGPRTLNGLILEYLETIPDVGVSLRLGDYSADILQTADNTIKTVRMRAQSKKASSERAR
jgi:Mg2+/Co2+ transporter CorB